MRVSPDDGSSASCYFAFLRASFWVDSQRANLLVVLVEAPFHEIWRKAADHCWRNIIRIHFDELEVDRSFRLAGRVYCCQEVTVKLCASVARPARLAREPITDRSRGTDDPARKTSAILASEVSIEDAIDEEVRMAGENVHELMSQ